jgi:hypothetical protein
MKEKGILVPELYSEVHERAALRIQRAFRALLVNRYKRGRQISNLNRQKKNLWSSVVLKY